MHLDIRRDESGFTLIELLVAIAVSSILLVAATTGFVTAMRGTAGLHDRFVQSHDAQLLAVHFPADVQSADPDLGIDVDPNAWSPCTGTVPTSTTNVVLLRWAETVDTTTTNFTADYRLLSRDTDADTIDDEWKLVRYLCTDDGSTQTVSSHVVAHNLQDPTVQPPVVTPSVVTPSTEEITLQLFSAPGNVGDYSFTFSGRMRTPQTPPPYPGVSAISRVGSSPTNTSGSLQWKVVFDRNVTGVNIAGANPDFAISTGSVPGATITSISGSGDTYTVTASSGTGSGTLGLNVTDNDSIVEDPPTGGEPLGSTGASNGDYSGQVYTIDRTSPAVTSIATTDTNPTVGPTASWTVAFGEDVGNVDIADFSLVPGALITGASLVSVTSTNNKEFTVTANTGSGDDTLTLNLVDDDTITDAAGNPLGGSGAGNGNYGGQTYNVDNPDVVGPSIVSVQLKNKSGGTAGRIEEGDQIIVEFSTTMKVSSFCDLWTGGNASDDSLTAGDQVTVNLVNSGSNDTLSVASSCGSSQFGSLDLNGDYVSGAVAISGGGSGVNTPTTAEWNASSHKLTITFGRVSHTTRVRDVSSGTSPAYTTGATDPAGNGVIDVPLTLSPAAVRF